MNRILTGLVLIVTLLVGLCSAEPGKGKLSPGMSGDADAIPAGDWSRCRSIAPGHPGAWSVPLDPGPTLEKLVSKPITLPAAATGQPGSVFERVEGLFFARDAGRACVVIHDTPFRKPAESRLEVLDLVSGKMLESVRWPSSLKPVGIDRAGEFVLARSDFHFARGLPSPALGVWKLSDGALEPVRLWSPQAPDSGHNVMPSWAAFIDADHVACITFPASLTVWNVPEGRAIYSMEISFMSSPAISPGGKQLAAAVEGGIVVLDALDGDTLGWLPDAEVGSRTLSFRPDGAQIASLSPQRVVVWDLVKGEIYRDFAFATGVPSNSVAWVAGGHLLAGGDTLIDLERRLVLWKYSAGVSGGRESHGELGGFFWHILSDRASNQRSLHPAVIPHDDALRMAATIDPEQVLAVRPGASFTLDVRVQEDPAEQQKVQETLAARLEAAGMTVGDGGTLVLQATTETGPTKEVSYQTFGRLDRNPEKEPVIERISRVKIIENGLMLWECRVSSSPPMHIHLDPGQSIQEAIAPYQQPDFAFFSGVYLPTSLARPPEHGAYGFSQLTPKGIVNIDPPVPAAGQAK